MPRVAIGSIGGMKPPSAVTKTMRVAADRLYDAFLRDPDPSKRFGRFDRAYSEFVRTTGKEFEKMAMKIFRMWKLPEAVEPQDVMQDLHVEIVRILKKYKPEKATVAAYLVWNAFARAKKECNKQRGKCKDRDPSMHALVISGLLGMSESGPEQFADCIDRLALESDSIELDRECEAMLDNKKLLRRVRAHLSEQDSRYVRRVVRNGGNIRQTAFGMISAVDEMDEATRELAIKRKTKKLIAALKNAAFIWARIEKQEQEHGSEEERQEAKGIEERRDDGSENGVGTKVRNRRSETRIRATRSARVADRRHRNGANGSAFFLLCA